MFLGFITSFFTRRPKFPAEISPKILVSSFYRSISVWCVSVSNHNNMLHMLHMLYKLVMQFWITPAKCGSQKPTPYAHFRHPRLHALLWLQFGSFSSYTFPVDFSVFLFYIDICGLIHMRLRFEWAFKTKMLEDVWFKIRFVSWRLSAFYNYPNIHITCIYINTVLCSLLRHLGFLCNGRMLPYKYAFFLK